MNPILIVDDQQELRFLMWQILEGDGFDCLESSDGETALQVLINCPSIALVLTDFNMPRMDGLQLLNCMKSHSKLRRIPVIVITADHSEGLRMKAALAGADAVLLKPFNLMEFRECIYKLLSPLQAV